MNKRELDRLLARIDEFVDELDKLNQSVDDLDDAVHSLDNTLDEIDSYYDLLLDDTYSLRRTKDLLERR